MATGKLLKVTVKKDPMTPHLQALFKAHSGNGTIMRILVRAAANLLRSHSRAKNNPPRQAPQTAYNKAAPPSDNEIDPAPHHPLERSNLECSPKG